MAFTLPNQTSVEPTVISSYGQLVSTLDSVDLNLKNVDSLFSTLTSGYQLTSAQAVGILDAWMQTIYSNISVHSLASQYSTFAGLTYINSYGIPGNIVDMWDRNLAVFQARFNYLSQPGFSAYPDVIEAMARWFVNQASIWSQAYNELANQIVDLGTKLQSVTDTDIQNQMVSTRQNLMGTANSIKNFVDKLNEVSNQFSTPLSGGLGSINGIGLGWQQFWSIVIGVGIIAVGIALGVATGGTIGLLLGALFVIPGSLVALTGFAGFAVSFGVKMVLNGILDAVKQIKQTIADLWAQVWGKTPVTDSQGNPVVNGQSIVGGHVDSAGNVYDANGNLIGKQDKKSSFSLSGALAVAAVAGVAFLIFANRKSIGSAASRATSSIKSRLPSPKTA